VEEVLDRTICIVDYRDEIKYFLSMKERVIVRLMVDEKEDTLYVWEEEDVRGLNCT
jgi:hypothetical protein